MKSKLPMAAFPGGKYTITTTEDQLKILVFVENRHLLEMVIQKGIVMRLVGDGAKIELHYPMGIKNLDPEAEIQSALTFNHLQYMAQVKGVPVKRKIDVDLRKVDMGLSAHMALNGAQSMDVKYEIERRLLDDARNLELEVTAFFHPYLFKDLNEERSRPSGSYDHTRLLFTREFRLNKPSAQ